MRARTISALASLWLLGATPTSAQLASYQAGLEGAPPVAPDPLTQGWVLNDGGAGNTVLVDVSPDGATGLNAWKVDDAFTNGGSRADYRVQLDPADVLASRARGWEYSAMLRVLSSSGPDVVFEFATGQGAGDDRWLLFLELSGADLVANAAAAGVVLVCPGANDGDYHELTLRKPAGGGVLDAELLCDGVLIGVVPRAPSSAGAPDGGVSWGTGSSGATGAASFHAVEFELGPASGLELFDVFTSGDGYARYRIPSVLTTAAGTVLAFAEGRQSLSDHAENDIVMRRSTDAGATWSTLQVLHDDGGNSLNDPCALEVRAGPHAGRVLLMFDRYPEGCHTSCVVPGYVGPNVCRSYVMHSDDDGQSWSPPREITTEVRRPTVATSVACGPGVGIQKRRAPNAGRLIVPFNQGPTGAWKVYAVYSDDGGDSWAWGELADDSMTPGTGNEVQMVELVDGSLLLNSRSAGGTQHRKVARSADGGLSWSPLVDEPALIEPRCMASTLRFTDPLDGASQSRLLYAGPDSTSARVMGTVHVSYDEGETWPLARELYAGGYAYSVLTVLADQRIGCLFERDGYAHITFARFTLEWLTEGVDCLGREAANTCSTSPNSVGAGALTDHAGSLSIEADDFVLHAFGAAPLQPGLFIYSDGDNAFPFGDGVLCVGQGTTGIRRLDVTTTDAFGDAEHALDLAELATGPAPITAGTPFYFQFWYRDPAGPGGSGFNLSDALRVGFCR